MKIKCLVTGHQGYIGSHLYEELRHRGYDTIGVDIKSHKNILDGEIMQSLENFCPDYIFHLAALPRVEYSVENPTETLRTNVVGTSNMLGLAKKCGTRRFIFSSSSAVLGDVGKPTNPYGLHKKMSEMECELWAHLYQVESVCLRYYNVYSEDQPADGSYSTVIAAWMDRLRKQAPLLINGNGEHKRDFVHVEDVVAANIHAMESEESFRGKTFEVGTQTNFSLNYIREYIEEVLPQTMFERCPPRQGDALETLSGGNNLPGWSSTIGFNEGLQRCFKK